MERDDFIKKDKSAGEEKNSSSVIKTNFLHFSADIIQQVYLWLDKQSQLQLSCTSTRLRSIFFKTIVTPQKFLDQKAEEAQWQKQIIINFFYKYDLFFENEDALLEVPENIKQFLGIFYNLEKFIAELSQNKDAAVRIISQIEKSLKIDIAQYVSRLLQPKEKAQTDTSSLATSAEKKDNIADPISNCILAIKLQFLGTMYSFTKNVNCTLVASLLANKFGSSKSIVIIADLLLTANKEPKAMSDISQIIFNFFSLDQTTRSEFLDDPLKFATALFYQSLDRKVKNKKITNPGFSNQITVVLSGMQSDKIRYLRNIFVNLTTIFSRYNALSPEVLTKILKIIIDVKAAQKLINFLSLDQVNSLSITNAKVLSLVKENELPIFFSAIVQEGNLKTVELLTLLPPNDLTLILEIILPYHLSEHDQIKHIKTSLDIINKNFEPIMEELTEESKDYYLIHKVALDILVCKKFMLFLFSLFGIDEIKDIAKEISTFHPKDILFLYEASTVIYPGLKNKEEFWESLREGSTNKEKLLIFLEKICEFHVFPLRVYVDKNVDESLEINSTLLLGLCELLITNKILNLNEKVLKNLSSRDFLPIPSNKIITPRNSNFLTFTESLRLYDDKLFWICGSSMQRLLYIFGNSVENMLELFYKTARNGNFYYTILQSFPEKLLESILIRVENTEELFFIIDNFTSSKIIQHNIDKFIALLSALKENLDFFDSVKCTTIFVAFGTMKANDDNKSILEIFFELNKLTMVEIIRAIHITSLNLSKKMTENIATQSAEILSVLSNVGANENIIAKLFDCDNTYKIGYLHRVLVEDTKNSMQFTQDVNEAIQVILQTPDAGIEDMDGDLDELELQVAISYTNRR